MSGSPLRFDTGATTHVGKVRRRNEDAFVTRPDIGLWAIADGMGGGDYGDVASRTVVDALASIEPQQTAAQLLSRCEEQIVRANRWLNMMATERDVSIGTTIAVLLIYDGHYACIWSGDSRIYLVRNDTIVQLTRDHTEAQELVEEGKLSPAEAERWPGRNLLTRAVGVRDDPELEIEQGMLETGDVFVICSDGLTAHVSRAEILKAVTAGHPQQACRELQTLTLERGAVDNVTIIVIRCLQDREATIVQISR